MRVFGNARYKQHVRVEVLALLSKFAGPQCLSSYGRLAELLGSLLEPVRARARRFISEQASERVNKCESSSVSGVGDYVSESE